MDEEVSQDKVKRILKYDALHEAEAFTGSSYKEDKTTESIGVGLHLISVQEKQKIMEATNDTTFSMSVDDYIRVITNIGFEKHLELEFKVSGDKQVEKFFVYFDPIRCILLKFDTYLGQRNSGSFYYNWKPYTDYWPSGVISSGGMERGVWVGDHDCREGVRFHIAELEGHGEFVNPWEHRQHTMWLTHRGDVIPKDDHHATVAEYDRLTEERIAMLPEEVRLLIKGVLNASNRRGS